MNDLESYQPDQWQQEIVNIDETAPVQAAAGPGLTVALLQRWRTILLTFILLCAAGVPPIWIMMEAQFNYEGAIRVAPILMNPLSGEKDTGEISNYRMFANTEAELVVPKNVPQMPL